MRIFRPGGAPTWLELVLQSIERGLREIWPLPFRLWRAETTDLPPASEYEGAWLYDQTETVPKFSDGTDWVATEAAIAAGTTAQYWRGDKSWQPLNGLAVANTPAGGIAAVTVQAAIDELDSEKLPTASYTAADVLTKIKTVDGAGSGLDSDLLDGQEGVYYLARANHTGTQLAATISDFNTAADARIVAAVGVSVQAFDADLTAIAGLTATTDNFIVSVASAWASRTPAQVRTTLGLAAVATSGSAADLSTGTLLAARMPALVGDVTTAAGAVSTTLATVNTNVGSFGSATQVATFTVNAKGLTTAAANVTITPAVGSITGLGTGVASALAVAVGSTGAFVTFNGAGGTPSSLTLTNATGLPTAGLLNDAVTYAKIQNVSATDRLLGRSTAGTGDVEEIVCTAAGRALIDDADAATQRATLGLTTAPALTALTLSGGVTNVGAGYASAGWRKAVDGRVHLEGYLLGGGGASGVTITTLPVGARPSVNHIFASAISSGGVTGISMIDVQTNGSVFWYTSNTSANLSLSGINFQT